MDLPETNFHMELDSDVSVRSLTDGQRGLLGAVENLFHRKGWDKFIHRFTGGRRVDLQAVEDLFHRKGWDKFVHRLTGGKRGLAAMVPIVEKIFHDTGMSVTVHEFTDGKRDVAGVMAATLKNLSSPETKPLIEKAMAVGGETRVVKFIEKRFHDGGLDVEVHMRTGGKRDVAGVAVTMLDRMLENTLSLAEPDEL